VIVVPRDRVRVAFARSGGPGGQHVNKTATKAEVRFRLDEADWLSPEARARVAETFAARLTKDGDFVVTCDETRSQKDNLDRCFLKLEALLTAATKPVRRRKKSKPTRASKLRRLEGKRARGALKRSRRESGEG
jgi:ribosome-associated protein